jgi:hypothetical protein
MRNATLSILGLGFFSILISVGCSSSSDTTEGTGGGAGTTGSGGTVDAGQPGDATPEAAKADGSSGGAGGTDSGGGGGAEASIQDGSDGAVACTTLQAMADRVQQKLDETAGTGLDGISFPAGTYDLVDDVIDNPSGTAGPTDVAPFAESIKISALTTTGFNFEEVLDDGTEISSFGGTAEFVPDDSGAPPHLINVTLSCPAAKAYQLQISGTVAGHQGLLLQQDLGGGIVETFSYSQRICNGIYALGDHIDLVDGDGGVPEALGGTITDGKYVLTGLENDGADPTVAFAQTLVISGAGTSALTIQSATEVSEFSQATWTATPVTPTDGAAVTALSVATTCPAAEAAREWGYTASGNTLVLNEPQSAGGMYALTFTKQ